MLAIYVYGPKQSGYLELAPNSRLQMERLADLFDEDFTIGEFSVPMEAPWSPHNRKLLGYPEQFTNSPTKLTWWKVDIYNYDTPISYGAKMRLSQSVGRFNYLNGKFMFSIAGTKGLLGTLLKNKKLPDMQLGGAITWPTVDSRNFAKQVMMGALPSVFAKLRFGPVVIENFFDDERKDYAGEFLAEDKVNNYVVGDVPNGWVFGRPLSTDVRTPAPISNEEYKDYRTVPFFRMQYVFKEVLKEIGYSVTGDWINDAAFDALVMFNNFGIEQYNNSDNTDSNRRINPKNHVPDIPVIEFLQRVAATFCFKITLESSSTVRLTYRKSVLAQRNAIDISRLINDSFEKNVEEDANTGFTVQYRSDSFDGYFNGRVQDTSDFTLVGTVNSTADLLSINPGRPFTTDDIAVVVKSNAVYRVADGTVTPALWEIVGERLGPFTSGDGGNTYDVAICPLPQYAIINSFGLNQALPWVGYRGLGSYKNNNSNTITNPFDLRMFYCKMVSSLPSTFYHNTTPNGTEVATYSLSIEGDKGLYKSFYEEWLKVRNNNAIIKAAVSIDQRILQELDKKDFLIINNIYFIKRQVNIDYPVRNGSLAELEFVEA